MHNHIFVPLPSSPRMWTMGPMRSAARRSRVPVVFSAQPLQCTTMTCHDKKPSTHRVESPCELMDPITELYLPPKALVSTQKTRSVESVHCHLLLGPIPAVNAVASDNR